MKLQTRDSIARIARLRAAETGEPYAVVSMDYGMQRRLYAMSQTYVENSPEMDALRGAVLCVIRPDGSVQV